MISLDGSKPKKIAFTAFLLSADTTNDICNCNEYFQELITEQLVVAIWIF